MKKTTGIAVIIPVYNVEAYLEACVSSLLDQDIDVTAITLHIILIDDGSTDNSLKIAEQFAKENEQIYVYSQANAGLSVARNTGLDKVSSLIKNGTQIDYILFLDSDDMLREDCLAKLTQKAINDDVDLLFFIASVFYDTTSIEKKFESYKDYYQKHTEYKDIYTGTQFLTRCMQYYDMITSACMYFMKAEFVLSNNFKFYEGIIHEDNLFIFKVLVLAKKVSYIHERFYLRRIRENSIMTQRNLQESAIGYFRSGLEAILYFRKYMDTLPPQEIAGCYAFIIWMFENSKTQWDGIKKDKLEGKIKFTDDFDKIMFQFLIIDGFIPYSGLITYFHEMVDHCIDLRDTHTRLVGSRDFRLGSKLLALPRKIKRMVGTYE